MTPRRSRSTARATTVVADPLLRELERRLHVLDLDDGRERHPGELRPLDELPPRRVGPPNPTS